MFSSDSNPASLTSVTTCFEAPFLRRLFTVLGSSDFDYCVLRNYETLPDSLGGSDLDLLVLPKEREAVADLVIEVAAEFGGEVIAQYATTGKYLKLLGYHEGQWWGAAVDLLAGVDYRGMTYVGSEKMLARVESFHGIKVASDSDTEVMALLKEMVNNSRDRKDYLAKAIVSYDQHGDACLQVLNETFSEGVIRDFRSMLENKADAEIADLSSRLRREIWREHGIKQGRSVVVNFLRRYTRLLKPPGVSLAVTGTDGAGKTTIIDAMRPVLEQAIHGKIQYEHLRPNWLKPLGAASGSRAESPGTVVTDPHAKAPSGLMGSLVRVCYYWLDYTIGYLWKIYPRLVKKSHICLFDRYYYDFIIDPRRMRVSLPQWVLRAVFFFAPKPRLLLCLGADPMIIYARKPETSLEEVTRQVEDLKQICQSHSNAVWVDTGGGIDDSINQALEAVQQAMSSRYRNE